MEQHASRILPHRFSQFIFYQATSYGRHAGISEIILKRTKQEKAKQRIFRRSITNRNFCSVQ
jgi:hypothetical protein